MKYVDARLLIDNGDIAFIRGSWKKPLQRIIMFFTNSKYSHVGITFWATINNIPRLMMIEAQGGTKRRLINLSYYSDKNIDIITSPKPWEDYCEIALSNIGITKYSWLDVFYIGLKEKLEKYIKLPSKNLSSGEICSEFVAKCLNYSNTNVSPQKLFETIMFKGGNIKLFIRK